MSNLNDHCPVSNPINNGVPQGSELSLTLFTFPFINDPHSTAESSLHANADDSILYHCNLSLTFHS